MNASTEGPNTDEISWGQTLGGLARHYLGGRRGLMLLTAVVVIAGLALNWSWLVAAGVAPLLLAFAPCAAMCALGMCMNRKDGKSCSGDSAPNDASTSVNSSSTHTTAKAVDRA